MCWCVSWCADVLMCWCWCLTCCTCWCVTLMCWCVDELMTVLICWCVWCADVDVLMCTWWCVDLDVLMCWWLCWCVDVLVVQSSVDVFCWRIDVLTCRVDVGAVDMIKYDLVSRRAPWRKGTTSKAPWLAQGTTRHIVQLLRHPLNVQWCELFFHQRLFLQIRATACTDQESDSKIPLQKERKEIPTKRLVTKWANAWVTEWTSLLKEPPQIPWRARPGGVGWYWSKRYGPFCAS
jgi:hypothetical protein